MINLMVSVLNNGYRSNKYIYIYIAYNIKSYNSFSKYIYIGQE